MSRLRAIVVNAALVGAMAGGCAAQQWDRHGSALIGPEMCSSNVVGAASRERPCDPAATHHAPSDGWIAEGNKPTDAVPLGIGEEVYVEGILVDLWEAAGRPRRCDWPGGRARRLQETLAEFAVDTRLDYQDFYSRRNLTLLGLGLGAGAVIANTSLDEDFQQWHDEDVKSDSSDQVADFFTHFGDGRVVIPIFAGAALAGSLSRTPASPLAVVGDWGSRCSRAVLVGGPPMLAMKYLLNGSRPEDDLTSRWRPFDSPYSDGAVSGHSFIGSIPFLTAAKMADGPVLKTSFYALSLMPGWARINDQRHYLSQAMLGWCFAYLAADVVDRTETFQETFSITPTLTAGQVGVQGACRW